MVLLGEVMEKPPGDSRYESMLKSLIESFEFSKLNPAPLILPSIFLFISMILLSYGLGQFLRSIGGTLPEINPLETLLSAQFLQWSFISFLGYTIASMIASYIALEKTRRHIYESSVTTYYFKGESTFEGLTQYLRSMYLRASLPSPVTGLILAFLTSGLSFPVIMYIVEKTLRDHIVNEESVFLGKQFTKRYDALRFIADLALILLTFGIYLAYMGYRFTKIFNKHIELIHGSHPSPPSGIVDSSIESFTTSKPETSVSSNALVLLLIAGIVLNIVLSYPGFYTVFQLVPSFGLILSAIAIARKSSSMLRDFILTLGLIYIVIFGNMLAGLIGHETFTYIVESFRRQVQEVGVGRDYFFTSMYIFTNNLVVSIPAIIPYIGGLTVGYGVSNAGLLMGAIVGAGLRSLHVGILTLIYPHSILELSAYTLLLMSSKYLFSSVKNYVKYVASGVLVLFIAAVVEAITIMLLQ